MFSLSVFLINIPISFAQHNPSRQGKRGPTERPKAIIKGKVVSESEGQPLDYATITIFSKKDNSLVTGAITDKKGKFYIETKPGNYFATIEFLSFQAKTIEKIPLGKEQLVADLGTIALVAATTTLAEVEVRAEKSQMQMSLDKRVFNVGKDLANTGASAEDILDNVPSVSVDRRR